MSNKKDVKPSASERDSDGNVVKLGIQRANPESRRKFLARVVSGTDIHVPSLHGEHPVEGQQKTA